MSRRPTPRTAPTNRELTALAVQLVAGGKEAAHRQHVTYQTHKNHISTVLAKLDVESATEAAAALGWLHIPDQYLEESSTCARS